jgi:putative acetyltransferase
VGPAFEIAEASGAAQVDACRTLFLEYQEWLGESLEFQGFSAELAGLPGKYAPPRGALLLATVAGEAAGCVALREQGAHEAEMKRLYVRARFRGTGLGRALAIAIIDRARGLGYRRMYLDTLPRLREALALYAKLGFVEAAPYNDNPIDGLRYLRLDLSGGP